MAGFSLLFGVGFGRAPGSYAGKGRTTDHVEVTVCGELTGELSAERKLIVILFKDK